MLQKKVITILMLFCTIAINAQKFMITLVDTSKKVSIRGLSVVDDNVIWCSGSNGSVARSIDGGKTFVWQTIAGYEKRDFRDIEAFDANTAIIMGIAEPAIILKTKNGGQTWKKVFEDSTKGMFLDAMDFDKKKMPFTDTSIKITNIDGTNYEANEMMGIIVGDPINNKVFIAITDNSGDTWKKIPDEINTSLLSKGEAMFASSGTNIKFTDYNIWSPILFVTGSLRSNLRQISSIKAKDSLPIIQGKESTGANSIDVWKNKAVIVGGDFANDKDTTGNCVLVSLNKVPKFSKPRTPPHGYRSCVIYINEKTLVTCGTSGVDVSYDGGKNWQLISTQSFHVVQKAKNGRAIFMAGSRGQIARLEL